MANYTETKGQKVQYLETDPTDLVEGQIWYNSTSKTFKVVHYGAVIPGVWSTGGNLATGRSNIGGAGTQTAGLAIGGGPGNPPFASSSVEEYDGSVWAAGGTYPRETRIGASAGIQTAAVNFGGYLTANTNLTDEYDGSAWTAGGTMTTARQALGGAGTQNAALAFGGYTTAATAGTEEYDGTSWTAGGSNNNQSHSRGSAGTLDAALAFGRSPVTTATEEYLRTSAGLQIKTATSSF